MSNDLLFAVAQAAVVSMLAGGVFWLVLRNFRGVAPNIHRYVWFGVLLLGLCVLRWPVDVPFYEPEPIIAHVSVQEEINVDIDNIPTPEKTKIKLPSTYPPQRVSQFESQHMPQYEPQPVIAESKPMLESAPNPLNIPMIILGVWASGVLVLLVRRLILFVQLHVRLRSLQKGAAPDWERLLTQFGVAPEKIPVLWTDNAGPALVRSMFGYRLLFPKSLWDELSPTHRDGVLRHELSHYLHGDATAMELARLLVTLQWFNPISWVALRKLEEATEWRCDDFAYFNRESGPQELIETLLAVHDSTESLGLYLSSFARINVIHRINRLLHTNSRKENTLMKKTILLVLFLTFLLAGVLQIHLVAKPQTEGKENESVANAATKEKQYLYVKNIKTTLKGEKAGNFVDPMNVIVKHLEAQTGEKWWRSNSTFSMILGEGVTKPTPNVISVFPTRNPDSQEKNWYKITIDKGVLIQGNTEEGLTAAAEHFIELLEGTGDDLRLPVGVFTSKDRNIVAKPQTEGKETISEIKESEPITNVVKDPRKFLITLQKTGEDEFEIEATNNSDKNYLISKNMTSGFDYHFYDAALNEIYPEEIKEAKSVSVHFNQFLEVPPTETVSAELSPRSTIMSCVTGHAVSPAPGTLPVTYYERPYRFANLPEEYYISVTMAYGPELLFFMKYTAEKDKDIMPLIPPRSEFLFHVKGEQVSECSPDLLNKNQHDPSEKLLMTPRPTPPPQPATNPETQKLITLAESMVTLPGITAERKKIRIFGKVLNLDGEILPGAQIRRSHGPDAKDVFSTVADENGTYSFFTEEINPEPYRTGMWPFLYAEKRFVKTDAEIMASNLVEKPVVRQTERDVTLSGVRSYYINPDEYAKGEMEINLVLKPPRKLTGTVHDAKGNPVADATVSTIHIVNAITQAQTDDKGNFVIYYPGNITLQKIRATKENVGSGKIELTESTASLAGPMAYEGKKPTEDRSNGPFDIILNPGEH